MILKDLMINLKFSSDPDAHHIMAHLLRHPDRRVRWRATALVGNSQYFYRYDWMRSLADYLAEELTQPDLPPSYRATLILSFGKTGDQRAAPPLRELQESPLENTRLVAGLCLDRLNGLSG